MMKKSMNLALVGYGLSVLYAASIGNVVLQGGITAHGIFAMFLFSGLLVSTAGVLALKDWGRKAIITGNIVLFLFSLTSLLVLPVHIYIGYLLTSFVTALYFMREDTRLQFITDWRTERKSVLVIDDDEALQKTIKRILLPSGYSVLTATTGERGMQVARVQKPDLILLDVILPGIKGREVCAVLTEDEDTKNIPIVFLTAKDSPDDIDAEMAAGGMSHLTKPVEAKSLLAEIKRIIG